jgi:adenine C2-methylase RlmN of 23S rRNA A2503 and tRNA A37
MRLQPVGYSRLGQSNSDGIRYVWQLSEKTPYIESAAFRTRARLQTADTDNRICAYTTSVSSGCALSAARIACKFCRTGNALRFSGPLTSKEIAVQNVFMVLSDLERFADAPEANNSREFAYMGQGEPGFSYTQLRQAIKITDKSMTALGQRVFRHILATCGVVEMVDALIHDFETNFFDGTRITFHYSLHATQHRSDVMPIDDVYSHKEIIRRLPRLKKLTGEKPCVGVLLFKDYCNGTSPRHHYTNKDEIDRIIALLDPEVCRISLCEFNQWDNVGANAEVSPEEAAHLAARLEEKGFQVKLFASFGKRENAACGLLGGAAPEQGTDPAVSNWYGKALSIIESVYE